MIKKNEFKRIENDDLVKSEIAKELKIDLDHLRNRKTIFTKMRYAWRRFAAPVNTWLFKRYVQSAFRAGGMKKMIKEEIGWQQVLHPFDEMNTCLVGDATTMLTDSPNYSRKENGKYPCAPPDYCAKCGQDWPAGREWA